MIYTPTCVSSNKGIIIIQNTTTPTSITNNDSNLTFHPRTTGFVAKITSNGTWSTKSAPIGNFSLSYDTDFVDGASTTSINVGISNPFPAGGSGDWTFIGTSSLMTYAGGTYILAVCKMLWSLGSSSPYDVVTTNTSSYISSAVVRAAGDYILVSGEITWETADVSNSIYIYNTTVEISGFD